MRFLSSQDIALNLPHKDVVFIGPVGSGKSSLIGSICRAINEEAEFPAKVRLTLNHPQEDSHGTMHWMETRINRKGTVIYQDTRGDQVREGGREGGRREGGRGGRKTVGKDGMREAQPKVMFIVSGSVQNLLLVL